MEIIENLITDKSISVLLYNIIERNYIYFSNCMLGPHKHNDIVLTLKLVPCM